MRLLLFALLSAIALYGQSSGATPMTTIQSQNRNDECNDERSASSLLSCALKLDSSIEQIREEQSKLLDSQAKAIGMCGLVAIIVVIRLHCVNHYKVNKKLAKKHNNA